MNKPSNRIIIVLFLLVGIIGFGNQVQATPKNCGGNPCDCECGDTVIANATFDKDLGPCPGHGLIVGANSITIDGGNHTITGGRWD